MKITADQYVPVLRWRMGEYQALFKLKESIKSSVVPLFEILPPDFDFEQWVPKKEIDEHLTSFGNKLRKKWGDRRSLLDCHQLDPATRMADGTHPMTFLFNEARQNGTSITPVIALDSDSDYQHSVRGIIAQDHNGAVLRCKMEEVLDPDFDDHVSALLSALAIDLAGLDVVLDLKSPAYEPQAALISVVRAALKGSHSVSNARSVVIIAASFPETMTELKLPIQTLPRQEWRLYKALVAALSAQDRRPTFGDYGVASINFAQGDMRFMRGSPNVRYATPDGWLVARAKRKKGETNHAYPGLCSLILSSGQYRGAAFSEGSAYVAGCNAGSLSRGNPTTWKWVATNQHITVVLDDLAKLAAI